MDESSSVKASEQEAGRCLFRASFIEDILEWEWACWGERRIKTRVIKEQSWWKTKHYWQGFVFPGSPLCPHWCPCLVSSRLSYPTGFTKLKRDWLFCSNFLCKPRPSGLIFAGFQEWWSYVCITVHHYSLGVLYQALMSRTMVCRHTTRGENEPMFNIFSCLSSTVSSPLLKHKSSNTHASHFFLS